MEGLEDLQNEGGYSGEGEISKKEVAFYKIMVKFDFSGDYLNYTYFRKDLAELKKIINIELETIEVPATDDENDNPIDGSVQISATLSTYRFPSSDTERYIIDPESEI
jgi:Tfp pilus assembly protein PilO